MKKIILIISLLIISIFLFGCQQQITCNKPYLLVGTDCCLDENDNSICDKDENIIKAPEIIEEQTEIEKWKIIGVEDGTCYIEQDISPPIMIEEKCEKNSDCYAVGYALGETDTNKIKCSGYEEK